MINIISLITLSFGLLVSSGESSLEIWEKSIHNPDNEEYVVEVAFNLDIEIEEVTQEQYNERYFPNK